MLIFIYTNRLVVCSAALDFRANQRLKNENSSREGRTASFVYENKSSSDRPTSGAQRVSWGCGPTANCSPSGSTSASAAATEAENQGI